MSSGGSPASEYGPAAGAVVAGVTRISAVASDNIGVSRVGFSIDGAPLVEFTSPPYEFLCDTAALANGARTIGPWAQDAAGNRGYAPGITVTVDNAPANTPPIASFTSACTGLTCTFTDRSTDAQGPLAAWSWTFGDGTSSTAQHPIRTYAAAGTYSVALTVTDSHGATSTANGSVTVSASPFNFSLSASPTSRSVNVPAKTTYTIASTLLSGPATPVALSVTGLPPGTTGTFDATTIGSSGSTTLRIATAKATPGGTYPLTVTSTGGGVARSVQVSLVVVNRK